MSEITEMKRATMNRLGQALGVGVLMIAMLGSALPANATAQTISNFDTVPQGTYGPGPLGNGWYVADDVRPPNESFPATLTSRVHVMTPPPAAPGSAAPSPPNSVQLGRRAGCLTGCIDGPNRLFTVVSTTPGRPVTVTMLAASMSYDPRNSAISVAGTAQDSPYVSAFSYAHYLVGGGTRRDFPVSTMDTLSWQSFSWTLLPTSDFTGIMISVDLHPDNSPWVDDIVIHC